MRCLTALFTSAAIAALSSNVPASAQDNEKPVADVHVAILADVSPSMEDYEQAAMKQGIAQALLSEQSLEDYDSGQCKAVSLIHFSSQSEYPSAPEVICSKDRAQEYIGEHVWNFEKNERIDNHSIPSFGTAVSSALKAAIKVFDGEQANLSEVQRRVVILVGDDVTGIDLDAVGEYSQILRDRYNARISGVVVADDEDCLSRYSRYVVGKELAPTQASMFGFSLSPKAENLGEAVIETSYEGISQKVSDLIMGYRM